MTDAVDNAPKAGESTNPDLKWYVVHAYSGMEKAVERNIIERIQRAEMQSKFGRILVPTEEVVEMKNGQKRTTERKEAMQITAYVFVFVFAMALFLWLTDKTLEWVFYDLILGWKK